MKSRYRTFAPLGLVALGGLLIVGALVIWTILPKPTVPTRTAAA